ncbi:hypothetical protein WCLP8_4770002 [uncultured Gammaproteobacteria bacterium]
MTTLPPPLVPDDCDVRNIDGFILDTVRLLGSEFMALSTGDEFKAAVTLWCRAWQQSPPASLPDDDRVLCSFAGYGRDLKAWATARPMAIHGFVKCSDGRLYHPVLAADAIRAAKARKQKQNAIRSRYEKATGVHTAEATAVSSAELRTKLRANLRPNYQFSSVQRKITPLTPLDRGELEINQGLKSHPAVVGTNRRLSSSAMPWKSSGGTGWPVDPVVRGCRAGDQSRTNPAVKPRPP